jgi:hypothetical protein
MTCAHARAIFTPCVAGPRALIALLDLRGDLALRAGPARPLRGTPQPDAGDLFAMRILSISSAVFRATPRAAPSRRRRAARRPALLPDLLDLRRENCRTSADHAGSAARK